MIRGKKEKKNRYFRESDSNENRREWGSFKGTSCFVWLFKGRAAVGILGNIQ